MSGLFALLYLLGQFAAGGSLSGAGPSIQSLSITAGAVGATVVITGQSLGATQGASTVKFNGTAATATSWSQVQIIVTVPAGATTGNVVVHVGSTDTNGIAFTVTGGSVASPIVAGRLPLGVTTLPNPGWAQAGVVGGIPSASWALCATSQCALVTSHGASATAAEIGSAIQTALSNTVVKLSAGTFTTSMTSIDWARHSNVALRGAGSDQTKLIATDTASCLGQFSFICMQGGQDFSWYGPNPPSHSAVWSAPWGQGQTTLTLSNVTGLAVGMPIVIDQLDDTITGDTGLPLVCGGPPCTDQGSTPNVRSGRVQHQWTTVTGIAGNVVTINPGVYAPNYVSSKQPGAWWGSNNSLIENVGIEDLSIDASAICGTSACTAFRTVIGIIMARNVWVRGVRVIKCTMPKSCVDLYEAHHVTIRDSYFYGANNFSTGSTTYGIDLAGTGDVLVENNIFQHRTSPHVRNNDTGSVFAYNFAIDDYYHPTSSDGFFLQANDYTHEAGNMLGLSEGNENVSTKNDIIHGTANFMTYFRDYSHGWESNAETGPAGKHAETGAVLIYSRNRYGNYIGNVLGESGYFTNYQCDPANNQSGCFTAIAPHTVQNQSVWRIGDGGNPTPSDLFVLPSIMRWGNYDTVNAANRFVSSEVPSTIPYLPNPVPSTNDIPTSYYLSSKPSFMLSTDPWPGQGPDITCTGGNCPSGVGSHVNKNRARQCWESLADDLSYPVDESGLRPKHFVQTAACPWLLP